MRKDELDKLSLLLMKRFDGYELTRREKRSLERLQGKTEAYLKTLRGQQHLRSLKRFMAGINPARDQMVKRSLNDKTPLTTSQNHLYNWTADQADTVLDIMDEAFGFTQERLEELLKMVEGEE